MKFCGLKEHFSYEGAGIVDLETIDQSDLALDRVKRDG